MSIAMRNPDVLGIPPETGGVQRVLVVDDSRAQRELLAGMLRRWGYQVVQAGSGDEAMRICAAEPVDIIISDWMMPGMNGLDFCRAFRAMEREHYGYFILLTSKTDKADVAEGLDVGADDFLSKPVAGAELIARIRAGERILRMERELTEKNRLVSSTLQEISGLYDSLDRDLVEARKLQQSLVRERSRDFGAAHVSLLLRPRGHVGGDLVGFYPINAHAVGMFSLDVSGHGIASALMTARLAAYLTGSAPAQNLALAFGPDGGLVPRAPSEVAARLNRLLLEDMETEHYFTMLLAHLDLQTGAVQMAQCGHPHPVIERADGRLEFVGTGGMPVGLLPQATFEYVCLQLDPGDRLLIHSDGITECTDAEGALFGEAGLRSILARNRDLRSQAFFEALIWDLSAFTDEGDFPDDVSALMLEYRG